MPSESGSGWSPPASNSERRLSNSSEGSACSGYSKTTSDSTEFLSTRPHTAGVLPGKPAGNPLQFVKVGPAELGSRAREQLRKAELAKQADPARVERQEDWQSNLDNWKSSRRKRVEHIIDRCVEARRLDESTQPRAKAKTFNEMLEERAGRRKKNHLALYLDDDNHDLSDLGIGTSSTKSSLSEDCDTQSLASDGMDLDKNHSDVDMSTCDVNRKLGSSANEYDTCTTTTISSPEPEEYTYEGAIEGYKSRIISQTNSSIIKTVVNNNNVKAKSPGHINTDLNRIRTTVSNKIEEKVSSFQQDRNNDIKSNNPKKDLPKIDIHKRREQFLRENSQEPQTNKPKLPEISNKTSIKERLSHLEKFSEEKIIEKSNIKLTKLPVEVKPLKERLSSLEKVRSGSIETEKVKRLSNGDINTTKSVKERLSSFKSQLSEEEVKIPKTEIKEMSMSLKERLSCLDAAKNKEVPKISVEEDLSHNANNDSQLEEENKDGFSDSSLKSSLTGIESQMQSFCRSLDSLDINGQSSPTSFDRVQSLEDFECGELQNNTVPSDIETEDSGIHTARDSCAPPDDIADLTQVASPLGEPMVEISEYESSNEDTMITLQPVKIEEPPARVNEPIATIHEDITIEEIEESDTKTENTDSGSNYLQAMSQLDESSVTEEVTEIQLDKDDEDTLKSLDNQDTSVSLNEPVSGSSDGDAVVFEGKMTIHLNLNEICNTMNAGAGTKCNRNETSASETNSKCMPMVIDALDMAFQELDSEDGVNLTVDDGKQELADAVPEVVKAGAPLYENVELFGADVMEAGVMEADVFPLDLPATALEPPKEKPPPPPADDSPVEDELLGNGNFKHTSSARRIKKEIRNKRSSFLGLEAGDDELEAGLPAPRPDITSFLQQETKIEKLLYRKTLAHDMDAKLRDSRDSGVDFDRGPSAEAWYRGQSSTDNSNSHSRQNSEPYTHVTVTSDEEEATKQQKERFTTSLTSKLSDLSDAQATDNLDSLEKKLDHSQGRGSQSRGEDRPDGVCDDAHTKEVLRFERELLQLEQEELRRQRDNLLRDQTRIIQKSTLDVSMVPCSPEKHMTAREKNQNHRHSMPNLFVNESFTTAPPAVETVSQAVDYNKRKPFVSEEHIQRHFGVEESRKVLYDERARGTESARRPPAAGVARPPQPVLPPKPKNRDSIEREITMRSSRVPSAAAERALEASLAPRPPQPCPPQPRPPPPADAQYRCMTRHTLQALSAAPSPKLLSSSDWLQARSRRPANYNYNQHWLVQEAEQRRLDEQRSKLRAAQRHSYHAAPPPAHRPAPGDVPLYRRDYPLATSHKLLPQEYQRPPRPELPLRSDLSREPPIRPEISPRPEMPIRPEVTKRTDPLKRPEVPAPPVRSESRPEPLNRSELRPDVVKRPEVPARMERDSKSEGREDKMLSVSGRRKCSHCGEELGRGSAMIIESLSLVYHVWCFLCGVCGAALGDGRAGADVRLRGGVLHCPHCYSGADGSKHSRV